MPALRREWGRNNERRSPSGTIQECSNLHGHMNPKEVDYAGPARKWRPPKLSDLHKSEGWKAGRLEGSPRKPGVAVLPRTQHISVAGCLLTKAARVIYRVMSFAQKFHQYVPLSFQKMRVL